MVGRMKHVLAALFCAAAALALPRAASAEEGGSIVGAWTLKTEQIQVDAAYAPEGGYVCTITPAGGPARIVRGTWKADGDSLEVKLDDGKVSKLKFRLPDANTLELSDEKGNTSRMGRAALQAKPPDKPEAAPKRPAIPPAVCGDWIVRNPQLEFDIQFRPDGTFTRQVRTAAAQQATQGKFSVESGVMTFKADGEAELKFKVTMPDINCLELFADQNNQAKLVRREKDEVVKLRQKAQGGDVQSMTQMGDLYLLGKDSPNDFAEAARWYRKAAEAGSMDGAGALGWLTILGEGVPQDARIGLELLNKAASAGHARSMTALGDVYRNARGVARDDATAARWYRKAADAGSAEALLPLGHLYLFGQGVPRDAAEAVKWYRKSAEAGQTGGMAALGCCYQKGDGVPRDYAEALKLYRKAAEMGDALAMNNLASMYGDGDGVDKDPAECVKWLKKSIAGGCAAAYANLGESYEKGEGVPQDDAEAVRCYRLAADAGADYGMYRLGRAFELGISVGKDAEEAVKWYRKAAESGQEEAKEALKRLGR